MHKYDIIVPHFGKEELTQLCIRCLQSIKAYSAEYRLILIDNGSPEFDLIVPHLQQHHHLLVRNTENLGFVKATNQGLALATAPYIVFLNNDTEVVDGWLDKLRTPLDEGKAAISGPRSSSKRGWQGKVRMGHGYEILPSNAMLAFFCTMFKKEVFDKLGYLDEDFELGLGDDDWFCYKAQKAGYKLALVRNLTIEHKHRSTFFKLFSESDVHAMQIKAMEILRRKQLEAQLAE